MLTYDLFCGIPVHGLSAWVPRRDNTLRIEHEQGIVADRLNQGAVRSAIQPLHRQRYRILQFTAA
jgi:hypothetical protein